jgi:hypothetical protein
MAMPAMVRTDHPGVTGGLGTLTDKVNVCRSSATICAET